ISELGIHCLFGLLLAILFVLWLSVLGLLVFRGLAIFEALFLFLLGLGLFFQLAVLGFVLRRFLFGFLRLRVFGCHNNRIHRQTELVCGNSRVLGKSAIGFDCFSQLGHNAPLEWVAVCCYNVGTGAARLYQRNAVTDNLCHYAVIR